MSRRSQRKSRQAPPAPSSSPQAAPQPAPQAAPQRLPHLWLMVVAQLDQGRVRFEIAELAELLEVDAPALCYHARILWPENGGAHWRFTYERAVVLLNFAACRSRNVDEAELYQRLQDEGAIQEGEDLEKSELADEAREIVKKFRKKRAEDEERAAARRAANSAQAA